MTEENNIEAPNEMLLRLYLAHKLSDTEREWVRKKIEVNRLWWESWQQLRWNQAKGEPAYKELREYCGHNFVEYFDSSWALAEEWQRRNPQTNEEITRFYREVPHYIYNLAIWEASGQRPQYAIKSLEYLEKHKARTILDFGCGIGTDGIKLLSYGYQVVFFDFDNPSVEFLRWRLAKNNTPAMIFHPPFDPKTVPPFDTLWAMDVIEHLLDPEQELTPLLQIARIFIFATEDSGQAGGRHPFHIAHPPAHIENLLNKHGYQQDENIRDINVWFKATKYFR